VRSGWLVVAAPAGRMQAGRQLLEMTAIGSSGAPLAATSEQQFSSSSSSSAAVAAAQQRRQQACPRQLTLRSSGSHQARLAAPSLPNPALHAAGAAALGPGAVQRRPRSYYKGGCELAVASVYVSQTEAEGKASVGLSAEVFCETRVGSGRLG